MIELIKELPDNVVGILARGRVTCEECNDVLRPAMEVSLKRHDKLRLYYEIGCRFPGAGWDDLEIAIDHLPQWERIAIVTDTGWVRHTVNALRFLLASEVRVFTIGETDEGRAWITAPVCGSPPAAAGVSAPTVPARRRRRLPPAAPPRSRRPSVRPVPRGDRRYRHPSDGDRQAR
jgi:stage II sporulation SpoAA-like protein